jgi:3-oxoacyl-(acyl-carrier-protein) synthase
MNRVVVTGMGVVAPNGVGLAQFREALRQGRSGLRAEPRLAELNFGCHVLGAPESPGEIGADVLTPEEWRTTNSAMRFAAAAAVECWRDAGFEWNRGEKGPVDCDTAVCFGTGVGGMDAIAERVGPLTATGQVRRLGSSGAEQAMCSGPSALVGGLLGAGGQVSTNSSACATGTEAVINGYRLIAHGYASRVLAGATEGKAIYTAACFDAMRVTARGWNDSPERASRPLSASASGFVPACGAGALLLESWESAERRGATVYAEIAGASVVSGGQRAGGSMTASSPEGVRRCVADAVRQSGLRPEEIDYINAHLTSTGNDPREVAHLCCALQLDGGRFPWINATKSMIGHTLGASGAVECVATLLQMEGGFVHPSLNCEDTHPAVAPIAERIPRKCLPQELKNALKTSFGFGDVNACVIFTRPN